jgi:hypothetical protein
MVGYNSDIDEHSLSTVPAAAELSDNMETAEAVRKEPES